MIDEELLVAFAEEANESLTAIPGLLTSLVGNPGDSNSGNELYRAFHTIKGTSGFLGFQIIHEISSDAEAIAQRIRTGECVVGEDTQILLVDTAKALERLVSAHLEGKEPNRSDFQEVEKSLKDFLA